MGSYPTRKQRPEAIGSDIRSWTSRIHPDDVGRVVDGMHRDIDAGAELWVAEYRFRCRHGAYAIVHDSGFILRDEAGRGGRMVGGLRDLTAQKRIEAQALRTQRMESIGTLAGGIAHDRNNVLAPIMMSTSDQPYARGALSRHGMQCHCPGAVHPGRERFG